MKTTQQSAQEVCVKAFGENGFVFLDKRPWPYVASDKSDGWWLYYWSQANKNFVTLRPLEAQEIDRFRGLALPAEKAVHYAAYCLAASLIS